PNVANIADWFTVSVKDKRAEDRGLSWYLGHLASFPLHFQHFQQFVVQAYRSTLIVLGCTSIEPDLFGLKINLIPAKRKDLLLTPVGIVGEGYHGLDVIRTGAAHGHKFGVFKKAGANIVLFELRNVGLANYLLSLDT